MSDPQLIVATPRGPVRGVALVLHGGRSKSRAPVRPWQLAVLRMRPFAASLRRADAGLVVAQVRYRVRGWNGADRSPVPDAEWALDELAGRFPDVPVALVGHSMGGRTAVYVAGHDRVRAVVGLAPWIEPGDPVRQLAGRRLLVAHGDLDRMTDPRASAAFVAAAREVADTASYVTVRGERHAMLGRARVWSQLATDFVLGALFDAPLDAPSTGTTDDAVTNVVREALAGRSPRVV